MGAQLMAIAAEGQRQRYYLPQPRNMRKRLRRLPPRRCSREANIPHNDRGVSQTPNYGMRTWADLFTNRQLTSIDSSAISFRGS